MDDPTKNDFEILKMIKYIYTYTFLFLISMSLRDNHVKRTIIKR